jgi:hypothetical protein
MAIGAAEAETFWAEFLRSLARRGMRGVKLVISDAHEGLNAQRSRCQNIARLLAASPPRQLDDTGQTPAGERETRWLLHHTLDP